MCGWVWCGGGRLLVFLCCSVVLLHVLCTAVLHCSTVHVLCTASPHFLEHCFVFCVRLCRTELTEEEGRGGRGEEEGRGG